jgi:hypothetical protein
MEAWLRDVEANLRAGGTSTIGLYGEHATQAELQRVITAHGDSELLFVFYGHGVDDGFCTASLPGGRVLFDVSEHGWLCGVSEFMSASRLAVAAFCCRAATDMGRTLRRRVPPARFLGFTDYIDFVLEPAAQAAFARPMARIVSESVALGELTRDAWRRLDEEYSAVSEEWMSGSMAGSDRSLLVAMFLDQHRELIDPAV